MKKNLYTKRIEVFKKEFPNYSTSKNGNIYYKHNERIETNIVNNNGFNLTKNQLGKINTKTTYKKTNHDYIILCTLKGKLLIKKNSSFFKTMTIKNLIAFKYNNTELCEKITNIFFIGRKYEYLKEYPNLWEYRMFQNCNSIKEAKVFLGFESINNKQFYSMFDTIFKIKSNIDLILLSRFADNKYNLISLINSITRNSNIRDSVDILDDYYNMILNNNNNNDTLIKIPKSVNKLIKLHDELVFNKNKVKLDLYSKKVKYKSNTQHIEKVFKNNGLNKFVKLETPYHMYKTGIEQHHCIGSNYINDLSNMSFYRIKYGEFWYEMAIYAKTGEIKQFKGYRNVRPPKELINLITEANYDITPSINNNQINPKYFKHIIVDLSINDVTINDDYPKKIEYSRSNIFNTCELELPF